MNQQALIEKMAKAIWERRRELMGDDAMPMGWWDSGMDVTAKDFYIEQARAALTAYAEACGERVVWTNRTDQAIQLQIGCESRKLPSFDIANGSIDPGEELVARKVGTDGK